MTEDRQVKQTENQKAGEPEAAGTAAAKAKSGGPPAGKTRGTAESMGRRKFLSWLSVGWISFAAACAAMAAMTGRFMFPNVLFEPPQTFKAGVPEEYAAGEVSLRWKEKHGVWIVTTNEHLYVLSTTCTHLGCTPNWLPNENKFKCPCHGSGFYKSGINFEGPAPRPLERFKITLADNGQILIDKTRKYQQEKGQWTDPESFLVV